MRPRKLCHVRLMYLDIEPEEFGIPLTNTSMLIQYEVPPDAGLLWKSWDDGSQLAVYHGPSGQTYQLDELSAWAPALDTDSRVVTPVVRSRTKMSRIG